MLYKLKRALLNPFLILKFLICKIRSLYYSRFIDSGTGKITIASPFLDIKIIKAKNAKLIVNGNLRFIPHLKGTDSSRILLGIDSTLTIDGDFIIGDGVKIHVNPHGTLYFGGKKNESDSGITANTIIMVQKKITVGVDFICAWGVFISDSDWHQIGDQNAQSDVVIGEHVWIANNSTILKGTIIGNNCIVASQSKLINKTYSDNSLLAGLPAKIVKTNIRWSRDMINSNNGG